MDILNNNDEIPEQHTEIEVNNSSIGLEPTGNTVEEVEEVSVSTDREIQPELIEIPKHNIVHYLEPQKSKYWRFKFKNEVYTNELTRIITKAIPGQTLTVEFGQAQETPDMTIYQNESIVGKINLQLCDRRDANRPEKYYCKLYFYHFKNNELYQAVKTQVVNFFMRFKTRASKKSNNIKRIKTRKANKKHNNQRRKTLRRIRRNRRN